MFRFTNSRQRKDLFKTCVFLSCILYNLRSFLINKMSQQRTNVKLCYEICHIQYWECNGRFDNTWWWSSWFERIVIISFDILSVYIIRPDKNSESSAVMILNVRVRNFKKPTENEEREQVNFFMTSVHHHQALLTHFSLKSSGYQFCSYPIHII